MVILEVEEREKGTEEICEKVMTENFPQINVGHQTTDLESSENTSVPKTRITVENTIPRHIIFKIQN